MKTNFAIVLLMTFVATSSSGCIRRFAINKLGDALAQSGDVYASDNDPELIQLAAPFSLKLIESLVAESPRHSGLLLAASRGFTQYAYAFVQQPADEIEDLDLSRAAAMRLRARTLYLRARDYGLRGLEVRHRGIKEALQDNPAAVSVLRKDDVPFLYWTAVSWGAAISVSKDKPDLIADQPIVEAMIDRALELHDTFESGAIHSFLIGYEPSRLNGTGDSLDRSRKHFDQSMTLSESKLASPLVSLAETVSIQKQDRAEFENLLRRALSIDPDAKPEWRLENLIMQRRARWLLSKADQLILAEQGEAP
jgi:predicted anti-sigma-YlaC factor YlaD